MGLKKSGAVEPLREVVGREHRRTREGLLEQLHDADAGRRRWAARDLAAHAACAPQLGAQLQREPDLRVREALLASLAAIGTPAAAQALLPLLRSEDAQLRNGAIESLAQMPDAVAPVLPPLLADADADVRLFAVNLLAELRHPDVLPCLVQVLAQESAVNVVAAAIDVLAEVGGPPQLPALEAAAARFAGEPFVAFAARIARERMEAP